MTIKNLEELVNSIIAGPTPKYLYFNGIKYKTGSEELVNAYRKWLYELESKTG